MMDVQHNSQAIHGEAQFQELIERSSQPENSG
jgi:hypothetical protein